MTPDEYRELRRLFDELEPMPPAERMRRLDEIFPQRDVRRVELEAWLAAGDLLAQPLHEPLADGTLIQNRYRIERRLGGGGFAETYTAFDTSLHQKKVVLKFPRLPAGADPEWFDRHFVSEVRALASLNHPGIVAVLDSGDDPTAGPFAVLHWIDGPSLRELLSSGPLAPARAGRMLLGAAQALQEAHAKGIVHRDLKPENIIIRAAGTAEEAPVLIDFGISTVPAGDAVMATTTQIVGSPDYLAPEQAVGRPTAQSDIYALGCIAVELLTGQVAHRHLDLGEPQVAAELLLARHAEALPKNLRTSLASLLQLSTANRPASAAQLFPIFEALAPDTPNGPPGSIPKFAAAAAATALFGGLLWMTTRGEPDSALTVQLSASRTSPGLAAEPFALEGGVIHFHDQLRLRASSSLPARLYLFVEDSSGVSLLYAAGAEAPQTLFEIPARTADAIEFDDTEETVRLCFCLARQPWLELEQIAAAARLTAGEVKDRNTWQSLVRQAPRGTLSPATISKEWKLTGPEKFCAESSLQHRGTVRK